MISRNQIKFVHSLHLKKEREHTRQFLVEGSKGVLEALSGPFEIMALYALPEWIAGHTGLILPAGMQPEAVALSEMERMTALSTPGPVIAVLKMREADPKGTDSFAGLTLVLDEIQDPGNLGTIIRIADWFGIRRVVCSPGTVEFYNPKVIQATMGSFCRVEVVDTDLPALFVRPTCPKKIYGTFLEGKNIYNQELSETAMIIIGNESRGISPAVEKFVTDKITIPSYPLTYDEEKHAESLNAAIATAVVCAEFRRRFHPPVADGHDTHAHDSRYNQRPGRFSQRKPDV